MHKKWSCIPALLACLTLQSASARNIFLTPGGDPTNSSLGLFSPDPLAFVRTLTGPAGGFQVWAGSGGKYYVVGKAANEGLTVLQGDNLSALQVVRRISLSGVPVDSAISPDGRRLAILTNAGVQILDTSTDTILPNSANLTVGASPVGVAISIDSRRAFAVSSDQGRLVVINLENATAMTPVSTLGQPAAVSVSPTGFIYVSVQNAFYEIDPRTMELRNTFSTNGFPGKISFTPDSRFGIAPNLNIVTGNSAYLLDIQRVAVSTIPSVGTTISKVEVPDNSIAFMYSNQANRIFQLNLASPNSPAPYNPRGTDVDVVRDIVLSNEAPRSRHLFALTDGGLLRVELAQSTFVGPAVAPFPNGKLAYAGPASASAVASLILINNTQTVLPGATAQTLIVRAVDAEGVPVGNAPVTFTIGSSGTLTEMSSATNLQGYAQATATISANAPLGVLPVTVNVGGQQSQFTISVSTTPGGGGGTSPLGSLRILSGQGQVTSVGDTSAPMTVIVVDSAGQPVPNVPITWTVVEGGGGLGEKSDFTAADGTASARYGNFLVPLGVPYLQGTISASTGAETVNFFSTTIPRTGGGGQGGKGEAVYGLLAPTSRQLNLRTGEVATGAVRIVVSTLTGAPIPNVGLRIAPEDPTSPMQITCRGNTGLSDSTGLISCDAVATGATGDTGARIIVGEAAVFPINVHVEAGLPSVVRIASGNNQTGNAGQLLPQPLVVEVLDAAGTLLPGADVAWEVITTGGATLTQTTLKTDANGRATTRVTLGQTPGLIQIRARSGSGTVTFSLTTSLSATSLTITGGNNQTMVPGQSFATPLTVRVLNAQNQPVIGASVSFRVASGSATVPASATTNANGDASTTVTAGQTPGSVTVVASLGTLSQTFNLTVGTPGLVFNANSFVNAAGFQPGISPGGIAVITASGIATGIQGSVTPQSPVGPLPTSLAGVEVLFNGVLAPIYAVSNINGRETVNVQVPFEVTPGPTSVTIRTSTNGSATVNGVQIDAARPGIFNFLDANGRAYAVAMRPDGSYISSANPARRGEIIRVFAAGLGQTTPATGTNRAGIPNQTVLANVIVGINNEGVRLVSATTVQGSVGVYLVEMEVPSNTTTGIAQNLAVGVVDSAGSFILAGSAIPIQ